MFTHMVPFVGGILKAAPGQRMLALLILWIIIIYRYELMLEWNQFACMQHATQM